MVKRWRPPHNERLLDLAIMSGHASIEVVWTGDQTRKAWTHSGTSCPQNDSTTLAYGSKRVNETDVFTATWNAWLNADILHIKLITKYLKDRAKHNMAKAKVMAYIVANRIISISILRRDVFHISLTPSSDCHLLDAACQLCAPLACACYLHAKCLPITCKVKWLAYIQNTTCTFLIGSSKQMVIAW